MNFCGIICEYNPLHNGHLHHIKNTFSALKHDGLICVMSGNFVQRGETAVTDKYTRAAWAVKAGADLVIELPAVFALSPAANFAYGGVKILSSISAIKYLSFGSEYGGIKEIESLVNKLDGADIAADLGKGISYASSFAGIGNGYTPNNILAAEYIRAIGKLKSGIEPFTLKRGGEGYNSANICGEYCSAYAIREALASGNIDNFKGFMPDYVYDTLKGYKDSKKELFDMLVYCILSQDKKSLANYAYVCEGIENRIISAAKTSGCYDGLLQNTGTKRYPDSKIKRILMCMLLGITKQTVLNAKKNPPYAKILAIKEGREDILTEISKDIKIIARSSDYGNFDDISLKTDIFATQIYSKLVCRGDLNDISAGLIKISNL